MASAQPFGHQHGQGLTAYLEQHVCRANAAPQLAEMALKLLESGA